MKTYKYLSIAAFCALALTGCVKETMDWEKGVDNDGAKVYIENSTSTFYVQTAEEKAAADETKSSTTPVDDDHISLPVLRREVAGEYKASINLTLPEGNEEFFSVSTISYDIDGGVATAPATATPSEDGTMLAVEFTFPKGVDKIGVDIAFDINELAANKEYKFTAELGPEVEKSNYGANAFNFVIMHSAPVHNPWVVIGQAEFNEDWNDWGTALVDVAIHEHDFTDDSFVEVKGEKVINPDKTKRTLKTQAYYRLCIPRYAYQQAKYLAANGGGNYGLEDGDEVYFENCPGLMFNVSSENWSPIRDYSAKIYASPLADDVTTGTKESYLYGVAFYNHTTGGFSNLGWDGYSQFNGGLKAGWYYYPDEGGYSSVENAANTYYLTAMLCDVDAGSLYGATCVFTCTLKTNDLVENWENYFVVDYLNDINYTAVGLGKLESEYKGASFNADLYKGFDGLYKNDVYMIDEPYAGTPSTAFPVLVKDGKATLAANQPLNETILGEPAFFSQSDKFKTVVNTDENGRVTSIQIGIKLHYEGSDVAIKEYTETFTLGASSASLNDFIGTFKQSAYELTTSRTGTATLSTISSNVTIKSLGGNKVQIEGMMDATYASMYGADPGILTGEYDPNTCSVIVPAQYFKFGDDAATCLEGDYFMYFQPGLTAYEEGSSGYFSYVADSAPSCALILAAPGTLAMIGSSTTEKDTDGYEVSAYYYDPDYQSIESAGTLYGTFSNGGSLVPMFTKSTAARKAAGIKGTPSITQPAVASANHKRFTK